MDRRQPKETDGERSDSDRKRKIVYSAARGTYGALMDFFVNPTHSRSISFLCALGCVFLRWDVGLAI